MDGVVIFESNWNNKVNYPFNVIGIMMVVYMDFYGCNVTVYVLLVFILVMSLFECYAEVWKHAEERGFQCKAKNFNAWKGSSWVRKNGCRM